MKFPREKMPYQTCAILLLMHFCFTFVAMGAATYGGFIQNTHVATSANSSDTLYLSNAVPAKATLVVFETFEAPVDMTSGTMTSLSNYTGVLLGTQMDSSVHQQSIYSMYCTNGIDAGSTITMNYNNAVNSARAYNLVYLSNVTPNTNPGAIFIGQSYGCSLNFNITSINPNCVIVGMATSDGVPTDLNGAAVQYKSLSMVNIGNLDTNIGYTVNKTSGLVSGYFYTNCGPAGVYTNSELWTAYGTNCNKASENILVAFAGVANSDYYVDFANGNDTNDGRSTSTPWQHCPGDANATSIPASTMLLPGNTVHFKGGVTYVGEVDINASGSLGNTITFDGNSTGIWGTGMAQIDCATNYYHAFAAPHLLGPQNYITLNNFDIIDLKNNYNQTAWVNTVQGSQDLVGTTNLVAFGGDGSGYDIGGVFVYGMGWNVLNCNIHQSEQWWYRSPATGNTLNNIVCSQRGVVLYSATNTVIAGCNIWDIGSHCVFAEAQTYNFWITNNNFGGPSSVDLTNRGWFAVALEAGDGITNGTFAYNLVHDGWQREGDDALQRDHAGDWVHFFGTKADSPPTVTGDVFNIYIHHNFFYNDKAFQYANGSADSQIEEGCVNFYIYNNLWINPHHFGIRLNDGITTNVNILNNTFVCFNSAVSGAVNPIYSNGTNVFSGLITNNIVITYGSNSAALPLTEATMATGSSLFTIASDRNILYNPATLPYGSVRLSKTNMSLSAWTAQTANDVHSMSSNPLLISVPATGATSSAGNYQLTTNSPAIGAGANLSTIFTMDYAGSPRPGTGNWDIGAYQSSSPPPGLSPPTDLRFLGP